MTLEVNAIKTVVELPRLAQNGRMQPAVKREAKTGANDPHSFAPV